LGLREKLSARNIESVQIKKRLFSSCKTFFRSVSLICVAYVSYIGLDLVVKKVILLKFLQFIEITTLWSVHNNHYASGYT
jgi:hypothetical protein